VFANAGVTERGTLIDKNEEKPSKPVLVTLDVNLAGVIYCLSPLQKKGLYVLTLMQQLQNWLSITCSKMPRIAAVPKAGLFAQHQMLEYTVSQWHRFTQLPNMVLSDW
jgi:hypothetical protein